MVVPRSATVSLAADKTMTIGILATSEAAPDSDEESGRVLQ